MYYAAITRAEEKIANEQHVAAMGPKTIKSILKNRFSKGSHIITNISPPAHVLSTIENSGIEKVSAPGSPSQNAALVSEAEWKNASRAVRTAGWSSVFYLITTDILGPFSVP